MFSPASDDARALFEAVLRQSRSRREAFLRDACRGNRALFEEVSRMLAAHLSSEETVGGAGASAPSAPGLNAPAEPLSEIVDFAGTSRFALGRRLGAGGFGVVYQAFDRVREVTVALKTLHHLTPQSLYRFKREFRSLADVTHPNLVQLYELASDRNHWFFTMEMIEGAHFLDWAWESPSAAIGSSPADEPEEHTTPQPRVGMVFVDRLELGLRQLASGLDALHRSGHLHRDIKPSNVLVTTEGRVVIVDFGLVTDLDHESAQRSLMIAGTPAYMSPEQAAGLSLTAASDWYSVGVMLYEAITGTTPFTGSYLDVLSEKQRIDPIPPSSLVGGVPPELDSLCQALLHREPAMRPGVADILHALGDADIRPGPPKGSRAARTRDGSRPLVVRPTQMGVLLDALDRTSSGQSTVVAVSGPSGIGKSTLVRGFLDRARQTRVDTVILTGRCYERESVPYKALDSLIDAVAVYLKQLPPHAATALLPREIQPMTLLFPVLRDFLTPASTRLAQPLDPQETRRRAYAGVRDLLGRIGDKHPLVVFIDDLQWGDVDSAALLSDVMRLPDPPVMLLVVAYRDVETETSSFLRAFLTEELTTRPSFIRLPLEPLAGDEATQLASALLAADGHTDETASVIASESAGNPFFIAELVRFAEAGDLHITRHRGISASDTDAREASLAQMFQIRLSRLSTAAQRCLRLVSVNGRPIPEQVLRAAAHVPDADAVLALLRSERLVRARQTVGGTELESYHDRIREIVVRALRPDERAEAHHTLAEAFERAKYDPELLAQHFLEAGDEARAASYSLAAAEASDRALAFDRAARLYRQAMDLGRGRLPIPDATLLSRMAESLTNAGRCLEAADLYLTIPANMPADSLKYQARAAQQYLFGGRIDQGLNVIRDVMKAIDVRLPESRLATLAALLLGRLRVRLRGLGYQVRATSEVSADQQIRLDACWSVSAGLSIVDTIRSAVAQSRHFLLALDTGGLDSVHRAFCLEMALLAARGASSGKRVRSIRSSTEGLARRIGTPYARGIQSFSIGATEYLAGRWTAAATALGQAEHIFTEQCTGVTWEVDSVRFFGLWCLFERGDFNAMRTRFPALVADAADRGDLYATTCLRGLFAHLVYLSADDPRAASRISRQALEGWTQRRFHLMHLFSVMSSVNVALYGSQGTTAWTAANEGWGPLKRSLLLQVQWNAVTMIELKGRASLAAALEARGVSEGRRLLRTASRCADRLNHQRVPWASALSQLLRAGITAAEGQLSAAQQFAARAEAGFVELDMQLRASAARARLGALTEGPEGERLRADSEQWMREHGIIDAVAMTRMLAPHVAFLR